MGIGLPDALLTILVNRRAVGPRRLPSFFVLLVTPLMVAASLVYFYYLVSFYGDLLYWLGTDVNRMVHPVALLGWTWVFSLWADGFQHREQVRRTASNPG